MSETVGPIRLAKAASELNVSIDTISDFLARKNHTIDKTNPNAKLTPEMHQLLLNEFRQDIKTKQQSEQITIGRIKKDTVEVREVTAPAAPIREVERDEVLIKNLSSKTITQTPKPQPETPAVAEVSAPVETAPAPAPVAEPVAPKAEELPPVKPEPAPEPPVSVEPVREVVPEPVVAEKPQEVESKDNTSSGLKILGKIDLQNVGKHKKKQAEVAEPKKEESLSEAKVEAPIVIKEEAKPVEVEAAAPPAVVEEPIPSIISQDKLEEAVEASEVDPDAVIRAKAETLTGPTVLGKIDLSQFDKKKPSPVASSTTEGVMGRPKRKRKEKPAASSTQSNVGRPQTGTNNPRPAGPNQGGNNNQNRGGGYQGNRPGGGNNQGGSRGGNNRNQPRFDPNAPKPEITEKQIQDQIKATMARISGQSKFGGKSGKGGKKGKRDFAGENEAEFELNAEGKRIIQATEFLTTAELAQLMDVTVTEVISNCFGLGIVVSINQRLDAETITVVADEFGFDVQFVSAIEDEPSLEEENDPENMQPRAPIVTIMGHVDHGKTSLLDYIRSTNVIAGEAGGITQHIGAYEVTLSNGKEITFLDTPGHEAFTAMRARGAKVTDIVVVVIAADDQVMPQTKEAISHAQAANVPIIFALNKIDRPEANPDRIREQLAQMNILVESWGGKYQEQEISAKKGLHVEELLEKILLEAEILDLKADPDKRAVGTVIEASLDKGKGIVTTVLVETGTLHMGDTILAGSHYGRVKALMNERGQRVKKAGPATPVQILGFTAAPTAGDKIYVTEDEQQAKEIAARRQQLAREQGLRTKKHITLDEIGRRLAIGNFKELNVIVKGDVDGSIEALADSLLRLSTQEVQVNIIYKGVGQISESDVLLASASDAIIIGFQVRPLPTARKLAEQEEIDIRLYSIIYDAIEEIKSAMEGMLAPTYEERVVCNIEIRETFKISKVGTIAGCMVLDGKINRNTKVRIIREGVVIFTGELASLKRFKEDVKEVSQGYECGLNINNFNDIKVGDIVEGYERVEVKGKLSSNN